MKNSRCREEYPNDEEDLIIDDSDLWLDEPDGMPPIRSVYASPAVKRTVPRRFVSERFLEREDWVPIDSDDLWSFDTRIPVDDSGRMGFVASVSKTSRTAIVAVMRKDPDPGDFPRLGDVKFVEVDLDLFRQSPLLH